MVIEFLNVKRSSTFLGFAVAFIALRLLLFLSTEIQFEPSEKVGYLPTLLFPAKYLYLHFGLSTVYHIGAALLVNRSISESQLPLRNSFAPALAYLLLILTIPSTLVLSLDSLLVLVTLAFLAAMNQIKGAKLQPKLTFNIALFLGLVLLFNSNSLVFLPILWVKLFRERDFFIRELIISLIAVAVFPYISISISWIFNLGWEVNLYPPNLSMPEFSWSNLLNTSWLVVLWLTLWIIRSRQILRVKNTLSPYFLLLLFSIPLYLLNLDFTSLQLLLPGLAISLAMVSYNLRSAWVGNIIIGIILAAGILNYLSF
ncbi:MAG TPA: hypothetical protein DDX92_03115 [Flavobacteriales bacterium]|jgi:hypothetical protein|nr:hypothetical protein [Flavobacteriales bacterium]